MPFVFFWVVRRLDATFGTLACIMSGEERNEVDAYKIDLAVLSDNGLQIVAAKAGIKRPKSGARSSVVTLLRDKGCGQPRNPEKILRRSGLNRHE